MPQPPLTTLSELDGYTDRIPLGVLKDWLARTDITLETVRAHAVEGLNFISVGALTHSAPALDLSLILEPLP